MEVIIKLDGGNSTNLKGHLHWKRSWQILVRRVLRRDGSESDCIQVRALFHCRCDHQWMDLAGTSYDTIGGYPKNETKNLRITSCDGVIVIKLAPQGI